MDLLKGLPLDEKYCHPAIKKVGGLIRFSLGGGGGFKNHMQYAKVHNMMVVCV